MLLVRLRMSSFVLFFQTHFLLLSLPPSAYIQVIIIAFLLLSIYVHIWSFQFNLGETWEHYIPKHKSSINIIHRGGGASHPHFSFSRKLEFIIGRKASLVYLPVVNVALWCPAASCLCTRWRWAVVLHERCKLIELHNQRPYVWRIFQLRSLERLQLNKFIKRWFSIYQSHNPQSRKWMNLSPFGYWEPLHSFAGKSISSNFIRMFILT